MSSERTKETSNRAFLTNRAYVPILLAREPDQVMRQEVALVDITERAVQRIVAELEEGGYIVRSKEERKNHYQIAMDQALRHEVGAHCRTDDILRLWDVAEKSL